MRLSELYLYPTTVLNAEGKFHPAIMPDDNNPFYWPNITYDNEMEAFIHAERSIADVLDAANRIVECWNVVPQWGDIK